MIMEYKNRINSIIEEKKDLDDISGTDSLILSEIKSDQEELVTIGVSHRKELKYGIIEYICSFSNTNLQL